MTKTEEERLLKLLRKRLLSGGGGGQRRNAQMLVLRPPPLSGAEVVSALEQIARTRTRAECVALAQSLLSAGAIRPAEAADAAVAATADGGPFDERRMYAPQLLREHTPAQLAAAAAALRAAKGDAAVSGADAVDALCAAGLSRGRAAAAALAQELLNCGFLAPPLGAQKPAFRDAAKALYALRDAPFARWGHLLRRDDADGPWRVGWFVCKGLPDRLLYAARSPADAKALLPSEAIDLGASDLRPARGGVENAFEVVTPTAVVALQAASFEDLSAWVDVVRPLAIGVEQDNLVIEQAETAIVAAEAEANRRRIARSESLHQHQYQHLHQQQSSAALPIVAAGSATAAESAKVPDTSDTAIPSPRNEEPAPEMLLLEEEEEEAPPRAPSEDSSLQQTTLPVDEIPVHFELLDSPLNVSSCQVVPMSEQHKPALRATFTGRASSLLVTENRVWIGTQTGDVFAADFSLTGAFVDCNELQPAAVPSMHWSAVVSLVEVGGLRQPVSVWSGDQNGEVTIWETVGVSAFRTFTQRRGQPVVLAAGRPAQCKVYCAGAEQGTLEVWRTDDTGLEAQLQDTVQVPGCSAPIAAIKVASDGLVWFASGSAVFSFDSLGAGSLCRIAFDEQEASVITALHLSQAPGRLWTGHLAGELGLLQLQALVESDEVVATLTLRRGASSGRVESLMAANGQLPWTLSAAPATGEGDAVDASSPPSSSSPMSPGSLLPCAPMGLPAVMDGLCHTMVLEWNEGPESLRRAFRTGHSITLLAGNSAGTAAALASPDGQIFAFFIAKGF